MAEGRLVVIKIICDSCGGFDFCNSRGEYVEKHNCEYLNSNQLLLRIAVALESIEKKVNANGMG